MSHPCMLQRSSGVLYVVIPIHWCITIGNSEEELSQDRTSRREKRKQIFKLPETRILTTAELRCSSVDF